MQRENGNERLYLVITNIDDVATFDVFDKATSENEYVAILALEHCYLYVHHVTRKLARSRRLNNEIIMYLL